MEGHSLTNVYYSRSSNSKTSSTLVLNFFKIHVTVVTTIWLTAMEYICVTNDHGYVPLVVSTSRSLSHSWLATGFVTKLTRRVPFRSTWVHPRFSVGFVLLNLWFMCMFCISLFALSYFFCWRLCCLFFFDMRIMITPLVSSNST